jgi:hypothetical protein
MEPAAVVKPITVVKLATTVRAAAAVNGTAGCVRAVMHLRVSGSDTSENRARREGCYCECLHWLCHGKTFLTPEK